MGHGGGKTRTKWNGDCSDRSRIAGHGSESGLDIREGEREYERFNKETFFVSEHETGLAPGGQEGHRCSSCGAKLPEAHAVCPVCGNEDHGELWQRKQDSGFSWSDMKGLLPFLIVLGGGFLIALVLMIAQFVGVSSKLDSVRPEVEEGVGATNQWTGPVVRRRGPGSGDATSNDGEGDATEPERVLAPVVAPEPTPEGARLNLLGLELIQQALHLAEDEAHAQALGQQAVQKFEEAVEAGCVPALVQLGDAYERGVAGTVDTDRAFAYYMEAAEAGSQPAQVRAGLLVAQGLVDGEQCPDCLPWLERARQAEMAGAYAALGLMHLEGRLLPMDGERAMVFLRAAAQAGQMEALNGIGYQLMTGKGGPRDLVQAYAFFKHGATADHPEGLNAFHRHLKNTIALDMDTDTPVVEVGDLIVVRKYTGLVVRGTIKAMDSETVTLGQPGGTVDVDLLDIDARARMQLDSAFRLLALRLRILEYLSVLDPPQDTDADDERKADLRPEVQRENGLAYLKGLYGRKDYSKAYLWLRLAALQGDPVAQYHLGFMYYRGLGVDRDRRLALGWMDRARQAGYGPARESIAKTWEKQPGFASLLATAQDLVEQEHTNQLRKLGELVDQPGYDEFFALADQSDAEK